VLRAVLDARKAATLDWDSVTVDDLSSAVDVWWVHSAFENLAIEEGATEAESTAESGVPVNLAEVRSELDVALAHLNEAIYGLSSAEVRIARSQFRQFFDVWDEVQNPIAQLYPGQYDTIDAEIERADIALLHSIPEDVQTAHFALVGVRGGLIEISRDLERRVGPGGS
jgi:hypothetical protein